MKLKKKYKTKFDNSVKFFFLLSLIMFAFTMSVLLPYVTLAKSNNLSLKNEIASLEEHNDTLKAENGILNDRFESMELEK